MRRLCYLLPLLLALAPQLQAQAPESHRAPDARRVPLVEPRRISPDRAVAAARAATDGRVLDVVIGNGGSVYLVRVLLANGRVRTIRVDAQTGATR
jgi:uncharacterized membrane protein YkoI